MSEQKKVKINMAKGAILQVLGNNEMTCAEIEASIILNQPELSHAVHHAIRGMSQMGLVFGKEFYSKETRRSRMVYRKTPWPDDTPIFVPFAGKLAAFLGYATIRPISTGQKPTAEQLQSVHDGHKKEPLSPSRYGSMQCGMNIEHFAP